MKNAIIILLILLVAAAVPAVAQKVGTTSLQFLKVMPVARATALGEAYVTLANGADAMFWNPAGMSIMQVPEVSSTMTFWLFDTKQGSLAYAHPFGDAGALGVQLQYVDYGLIPETNEQYNFPTNPGLTGRSFRPYAYLLGITYSRSMTNRFSTGVSVKYVHESLFDSPNVNVVTSENGNVTSFKTYANAILFDFGIRYNSGYHSIQMGASIQNLGPPVKFNREHYDAPLTFRIGTCADIIGGDALFAQDNTNRITVTYDIVQPNDYTQQMQAGVEYAYTELVAFRAGYKFNYDYDGVTLGAGLNTDLSGIGLGFDYSYGAMGTYLPNVHRISLGLKIK
jgi:hypothetical protein